MSPYQGLTFLFVSIAAGLDDCVTVSSIEDYFLIGHAFTRISGKSLMTCIVSCDQDPNCYSLNYKFPTKTCELNNVSRSLHPEEFVLSPDAVYFDHPSRPSGSCSGDWPCRNKGKCVNVAGAPGFRCECRYDYIGDTCKGNKTTKKIPITSDGDDRMGAKVKTPKKSLDKKLTQKNPMPNFRVLKISRNK